MSSSASHSDVDGLPDEDVSLTDEHQPRSDPNRPAESEEVSGKTR